MGGECNYLLRVTPDTKRLEFVPDDRWQTPCMRSWKEEVRVEGGRNVHRTFVHIKYMRTDM
jgi:IMP and pyridine-specific 5'-nucleotidase